ncbi:MAG: hypothetical protein WCF84_00850 [Anaerolineae bacterium]
MARVKYDKIETDMRKLLLVCAMIVLAGCANNVSRPAGNAISPAGADLPTLVPDESPVATATDQAPPPPSISVPGTPAVSGARQTFLDDKLGLAFDYLSDWTLLPRDPDALPGVTLRGPAVGQGPEPIIFAITVDVLSVQAGPLTTVVDAQLAQVPKDLQTGIKRTPLTLGNHPAEQITGLPSQAGAIETFVQNQGQVFLIILQPFDPSNRMLAPYLPDARRAYDTVLETWRWTR